MSSSIQSATPLRISRNV